MIRPDNQGGQHPPSSFPIQETAMTDEEFLSAALEALQQLREKLQQLGEVLGRDLSQRNLPLDQMLTQMNQQLDRNNVELRRVLTRTRAVQESTSSISTLPIRGNGEPILVEQDPRQDMRSRFHSGTGRHRAPW